MASLNVVCLALNRVSFLCKKRKYSLDILGKLMIEALNSGLYDIAFTQLLPKNLYFRVETDGDR